MDYAMLCYLLQVSLPVGEKKKASTVVPPFRPLSSTSHPGCRSSNSVKRSLRDACASGRPNILPFAYMTSPKLASSLLTQVMIQSHLDRTA